MSVTVPQVREWYDRAESFGALSKRVTRLLKRLFLCENRSLLYDLYPYIWDMECVLSQLNGYVRWLGQYPDRPGWLQVKLDRGQRTASSSEHRAPCHFIGISILASTTTYWIL